ncbi:glycerophosphodiester phosphodiesterase family protein [Aureimonas mangrovi]|uniref:glycerophosphodiester phosphodiesterase family protein n=1 Tax=Aureimonas mangrovi TaxID=2758041 RepID=UPI00163DCA90|nr:glycerophosphodiester phosphodiesterase family protein [Aureimonas mangrovi]
MSTHSDLHWLTRRPIAHRGLHDAKNGIAENSMSAFRAALDRDFAIECDVHLSADGVPMIFHDEDLERMTGVAGPLAERAADELGALSLGGTQDGVPRLADLFALVDGRVPLVVELKGRDPKADASFADALRPLVESYHGPLALMSFDAWLIAQAAAHFAGRVPIGLTAEGTRAENLEQHRRTFDGGCSFVSYNVHHLPNPFVDWVREENGAPVISWTVRTPADAERSTLHADQITFEGFLPQV